jgi:protein-L-isoaspartate(D-aspartate) O-methyltransferase
MTTMNLERARHNMVEQQIRPWDVLDPRILDLIARAPREDYVPAGYRNLAYTDIEIPLPHGQCMMAPRVEARLLQALEIKPTDKILEIGTGTGYLASLLAALGRHVTSVEIFPDLTTHAAGTLAAHGVHNVTLEVGDAGRGWGRGAPYDVVVLTGSVPVLGDVFRNMLADGGRMFAVVGRSPAMEAQLVRRHGRGWETESLFETDLRPLQNTEQPPAFRF